MQYLRDTCITLCCFLQAYPSGAQVLMQGQAGMVTQLTSLHNDLLPSLNRAVGPAKNQPLAQQVRAGGVQICKPRVTVQHLPCIPLCMSAKFAGAAHSTRSSIRHMPYAICWTPALVCMRHCCACACQIRHQHQPSAKSSPMEICVASKCHNM